MTSPRARLTAWLERRWHGGERPNLVLRALSALFAHIVRARRAAFVSGSRPGERAGVPVIVVGNLAIGGAGKTPLAVALVEALRQRGFRPGVISRGYGRRSVEARRVGPDDLPATVGDEPLLIARRTGVPVAVAARRIEAARLLVESGEVDVLVADDGLQHYALARDIEIVLFDGRGVGNGWLLPAGPLREPPSRRRDFTVVNVPEITPALARAVGGAPYRMLLSGQYAEPLQGGVRVPLADLRDKRIVAAAGIGNPGRFFTMLRAAGLAPGELALPDHHDFLDDPFAAVDAEIILITEKDAVKCGQIENLKNDPRLWVVPVTAQLDGALAEQIVEKCRGCSLA